MPVAGDCSQNSSDAPYANVRTESRDKLGGGGAPDSDSPPHPLRDDALGLGWRSRVDSVDAARATYRNSFARTQHCSADLKNSPDNRTQRVTNVDIY